MIEICNSKNILAVHVFLKARVSIDVVVGLQETSLEFSIDDLGQSVLIGAIAWIRCGQKELFSCIDGYSCLAKDVLLITSQTLQKVTR